MKAKGARSALLAWGGSLLLHGLALFALLWWLGDVLQPAEPVARPVPMSLAMLAEPAIKPLQHPAEPVAEPVSVVAEPVSEPEVAPAPVVIEPTPLTQPKPAVKSPPPKPKPLAEKPRVKPMPLSPASPSPSEALVMATPAPVETQATPVLAPVVPAPVVADVQADAEAAYKARVRQAVAEHKHYPSLARRMREEGRVLVVLTLESSGALVALRIKQSSGSERLDEAALQAVRDAAPFPPFPEGSARQRWELSLPLSFSLN
jgi:protein TonB